MLTYRGRDLHLAYTRIINSRAFLLLQIKNELVVMTSYNVRPLYIINKKYKHGRAVNTEVVVMELILHV